MLKFRKQSELNVALEANLLDGVFRHKKLPVRHSKRIETYLKLADICRLIAGMRGYCHDTCIFEERTELLRQMAEQEIYGHYKGKMLPKTA
jgi:hypothetical protein